MSEQSEQSTITDEQIAAYQRQQAERMRQEDEAFGEALAAFLQQHGYEIVAWPTFTSDGRTVAGRGFKRVQ